MVSALMVLVIVPLDIKENIVNMNHVLTTVLVTDFAKIILVYAKKIISELTAR
jgi:hypothetical protein